MAPMEYLQRARHLYLSGIPALRRMDDATTEDVHCGRSSAPWATWRSYLAITSFTCLYSRTWCYPTPTSPTFLYPVSALSCNLFSSIIPVFPPPPDKRQMTNCPHSIVPTQPVELPADYVASESFSLVEQTVRRLLRVTAGFVCTLPLRIPLPTYTNCLERVLQRGTIAVYLVLPVIPLMYNVVL
ncbi:hypothetical protein BDZ89DRAFT_1127927 [Hymenopellis radicata]|nr:hypothetical protein BDZ89DRAFT_1127927 [Hymenopellis radicata]